jgi:uncharacterized surface protein with fasciclin (FAS1) repeats
MSAATKMRVAPTQDIVDTAQSSGLYTKLLTALKAAGVLETLKGSGPFTLFAPCDEAFKKFPTGAFEGLLKPTNKGELIRILKYHVIAGRLTSDELAGNTFKRKSVDGAELSIDGTVGLRVNKVKVKGSEIEASNGIIHAVDTVLIPPRASLPAKTAMARTFCRSGQTAVSEAPELLSPRVALNSIAEEAGLTHKFTIGQTVQVAPSHAHNAVAGNYEIRHLMPTSDYQMEPRYRIRNEAERHERVVTESDLMLPQETANR